MGGSSKSNSSSTSHTTYGNTTTKNPYYSSSTDSNGNTIVNFTPGSAGEQAYNFVNKNISGLLNNYLNPSLDSSVNQAKLAQFNKTQQQNLQNNIINPLANNNMIRSSQATNLYNNLSNQSADYVNDLIANSQNDTWNVINNLMSLYMNGYTGSANEENTSLNASSGNATTTTNGSSSSSSYGL